MMPDRCPTCGVYRTLRRLTGGRAEPAPPNAQESRKIEYIYAALTHEERTEVCADCRNTLGVAEPSARAAPDGEVVAKT